MRPIFLEMMEELNDQRLGCDRKAKDFLQNDLNNMVPTSKVEEVSLQFMPNKDTDSAFRTEFDAVVSKQSSFIQSFSPHLFRVCKINIAITTAAPACNLGTARSLTTFQPETKTEMIYSLLAKNRAVLHDFLISV